MSDELEWLGARYPLSANDDTSAVFLWLELPTDVMVAAIVARPEVPTIAESLTIALNEPAAGRPRRPSRIRVADEKVARTLRRAAAGIPIVVAPVPELDAVFDDFTQTADEILEPSFLGDGTIEPEYVYSLFSAAAALHRVAPWREVADQQVVRIDIPALGIDGAVLSVIGAAEESHGLLLFRSIDDFDRFGDGERLPADGQPALRSLSYTERKMLPPPMIAEIEEYRWPLAEEDAIPTVLVVDAALQSLDVTEVDMHLLTITTRAFLSFFAKYRAMFRSEEPNVVQWDYTDKDNVTVRITAPFG
jgi:hypothetical protein